MSSGPSWREEEPRLGVDGTVAGGLAYMLGVSTRYESASPEGSAWLVRAAYYNGAFVADEADRFQAVSLGVGVRQYWGSGYIGGEAAAIGLRRDTFDKAVEWKPAVNGTAMIGAKLEMIDISLHLMFPLASIGVSLGADFVGL